MKVIITGAKGFIGRAMTDYMKQKGHEVIGWDITGAANVRTVDMTDFGIICNALKEDAPELIVHCAGAANVSESVRNPDKDFDLNVNITHNLLFALKHNEMNDVRVVYLSSAAVYGNPAVLPIKESDKGKPISPYALHKTMCEDMCTYFMDNHGFDIKIVRIFSAYGAGLKKQIFWDMYCKYKDTGKLEMFGDGTESRDFINIEDLKQALFLIATSEYDERVINVANGREITIREIADIFADKMDISREAVTFNGIRREGDPHNWVADISVLRSLGYEQSVSIEDGISDYCDWVKTC